MIALVVVAAFVACAEPPHDPAGDPPSELAMPAQPPVVVGDAVMLRQAVVVELAPVGVPDETSRLATTVLVSSLRAKLTTHDVRGPETLDAAAKKAAAACSARACFDAIATAANVDDVVHGTVQKVGNGVLVTLDLGGTHAVSQVDDAAQLSTAVDAAVDALIANIKAPPKLPTKPASSSLGRSSVTTPPAPGTPGPPNDDLVMLAIDYALFFLPFAGSPFLLPLSQGLVHGFGGKQIVHNEYPQWWLGTLAGYGVYVVGGFIVVGMYAFAVLNAQNGALGTLLGLGALGVLALTLVGEPVVVWWVARQGAVGVGEGVNNASDKALLRGSPLAAIPDGAVVDDVAINLFD